MKEVGGHMVATKEESAAQIQGELDRLKQYPFDCLSLINLASCYNVLGHDDIAFGYAKRTLDVLPWTVAMANLNYAAILRQFGRHEEAFTHISKAHALMPYDILIGHIYAEELIRQGKWLEAWPLCAKYRQSKPWVKVRDIPEWQGEDIKDKRLMVVSEGGRGDAFWLFRFLLRLKQMGAIVTFMTWEDVGNFLQGHPWLDDKDGDVFYSPEHPYDYWVSVFELMQWLKVDKPYWPGIYLAADKTKALDMQFRMPRNGKKQVGLCWECGEKLDVRKFRSLNDEQATRLLSNDSVEWVSLQMGYKPPMACTEPPITTWADTAAIIENLDLVISMDTSVVHLAGAMGKPTWLILGGYRDCKWGPNEALTSGWYPSIRIFHNKTVGFDGVVDKVNQAINDFSLTQPTDYVLSIAR